MVLIACRMSANATSSRLSYQHFSQCFVEQKTESVDKDGNHM